MRRFWVLASILVGSCGMSQGALVYSNLGPGQGFLGGVLWAVYGSANTYAAHAASFTSPGDFLLTEIHIPLAQTIGTGSVVVSLQTDAGGNPSGTALTGALFNTLPPTGPSEPLQIISANDFVLLQAGVTYWIVVNPNSGNTGAGWNMNSSGSATPMARNSGPGFISFTPSGADVTAAFAVYGTEVPEPASWAFAGLGLAAVAVGTRRKLRADSN